MNLIQRYLTNHGMRQPETIRLRQKRFADKWNITYTESSKPQEEKRDPNLLLAYIQIHERRERTKQLLKSGLPLFA